MRFLKPSLTEIRCNKSVLRPYPNISNKFSSLKWIIKDKSKMLREIKSVCSETLKTLSNSFSKKSKELRQKLNEYGPIGKIVVPSLKISNNKPNSA
jgi:hypothetical protein